MEKKIQDEKDGKNGVRTVLVQQQEKNSRA